MKPRWLIASLLLVLSCGREPRNPTAAAGSSSLAPASLAKLPTDSLMRVMLPAVSVALGVETMAPRADSILAANGFTIESYEALMYRIAADTAASRFFESALGR